jgi:glycosyltransferase involved in cell wall biosynthesis
MTRRLCMVVHGPYPVGESRVAGEALAAIDAGWEVDVVAMRTPGEPADEIVDGVRIYRLPMSRRRGAGVIAAAREYFGFTFLATSRIAALMRRRRYSIVHVHNPPDFLVITALVPRMLGARVILDIHDFAAELFAMRFAERRGTSHAERVLQRVEGLATRFADAVVTVHDPYRRALEARGVPTGKITVVLNSLDERVLPAEPVSGNGQGFRVVYHGTITPHYGIELLVEAAAQVAADEPDLRVEIYGDGDALEQVRARASELMVGDRVYTSGQFLPHPEVLQRVRGAQAGVICNLPIELNAGALPTKLFEYALLRVPIVSADLPTIREHFSPDEVLFYEPGNADALADALRQVAADPEAAEARAEAARRRYDEYRWEKSAVRYVELLERIDRASRSTTLT